MDTNVNGYWRIAWVILAMAIPMGCIVWLFLAPTGQRVWPIITQSAYLILFWLIRSWKGPARLREMNLLLGAIYTVCLMLYIVLLIAMR